MFTLLKVLLTIAAAGWCTYYVQRKLTHVPDKKHRLAARVGVTALALGLGLYFALDSRRYTYVDYEMSEVAIGYPFRIQSNVRWYDGFSEDSVSPYPMAIRFVNLLVGVAIVHSIAAVAVYLLDLPEPGVDRANPQKKSNKALKRERQGKREKR